MMKTYFSDPIFELVYLSSNVEIIAGASEDDVTETDDEGNEF